MGFESSDDACVYKVSDDVALINTVDFFPPIVDDPYMFGQIAAANSLSDVYAMGGEPKLAMNLLTFPNNKLPLDVVKAILEGGNDKVNEAGATIVGGHSIDDKEPKYGLSVTGFAHPDDILSNSACEGDLLVITKKIGTSNDGIPEQVCMGGHEGREGRRMYRYHRVRTHRSCCRDGTCGKCHARAVQP